MQNVGLRQDTPNSTSFVPALRAVVSVHVEPFHCSDKGPMFENPTLAQKLMLVHETEYKKLLVALGALGLGTCAQEEPFHSKMYVDEPLGASPTLMQKFEVTHDTALEPAGVTGAFIACHEDAVTVGNEVKGGDPKAGLAPAPRETVVTMPSTKSAFAGTERTVRCMETPPNH